MHVNDVRWFAHLEKVFNKFAGKEVQVTPAGKHPSAIAPADTVVAELQKELKEMGLQLRVRLPDSIRDMSPLDANRVNISLEQDQKGKYRIPSRYYFG